MASIIQLLCRLSLSLSISIKSGEYSGSVCAVGCGINCLAGSSEISYPKSEQESNPAAFLQF